MNPEDIFTATEEDLSNFTEESITPQETETEETPEEVVDTPEVPETTEEEPTIEETTTEESEEDPAPSNILTMDDEEFEQFVANTNTYSEDSPEEPEVPEEEVEKVEQKPKEPEVPQIDPAAIAMVEALKMNGLLEKDAINVLIEASKGNKEALDILANNGSKPSEEAKDSKESQESKSDEDEDEFDAWLRGLDGDEETPEEKTEETKEPETKEPESKEPVDHVDMVAVNKIGAISREIIDTDGQEFLQSIDSNIDTGSFEMLKRNPDDLRHLAEQKRSGVMDLINDRVNQMAEQGFFPEDLPYLSRYRLAGNMLIQEAQEPPKPIGTRVGAPKQSTDSNVRHAEANHGVSNKRGISDPYSVFTMSEEDFSKLDK